MPASIWAHRHFGTQTGESTCLLLGLLGVETASLIDRGSLKMGFTMVAN